MDAVIKSVTPGSIAEDIGLSAGDILAAVDGEPLKDILDFRFRTASDEYELEVLKSSGDTEIIEITNDDYEELGVEFENYLIDRQMVCRNKCLFCFVDQLPRNMRKTLYYKDDDYRLSTLMGNYITLTNLSEDDINRIINLHLPRINVSVHTVDPDLRAKLLNNKNSDVMPLLRRFAKAGIMMDCQVVLCRDINDGKYLDDTVNELARLYPYVQSLSVVPVGLTEHRDGLCGLTRFDRDSAGAVINQLERHSARLLTEIGTSFVFASDELYVIAQRELPCCKHYEGFLQLENGVGLIALLREEFNAVKDKANVQTDKVIATGVSAAPYIRELVEKVTDRVRVVPIINEFLGKTITVAGLVTAGDIIKQLRGSDLGNALIIPDIMLNYDGVFLDDLSPSDIERELGVRVIVAATSGEGLIKAINE